MPVSAKIPEPARAKQPGFSFRALPPAPVPLSPTAQRLARELIVYHEPEHELSAAYGSLAAAIAAQLPEARAHILLFAKASQELSGGAMVLNLALARVAEVPGRVVVVDANLRSPDTAKLLGLTAAPGLHEVLAGSIALRRAVRESGCEGVDILTAGDPAGDTAGLLAGQAMQAALRHLRNDYRWVLVSAPHWDGRPDIVALAGACDVVYLYTTSDDDELKQIIPRQGGALRGCIILND
jgi:Mrp family chromosome partitioning ATPase